MTAVKKRKRQLLSKGSQSGERQSPTNQGSLRREYERLGVTLASVDLHIQEGLARFAVDASMKSRD